MLADPDKLITWDDVNTILATHRLEPPRFRLSADGEMLPAHRYTAPVTTRRHTVLLLAYSLLVPAFAHCVRDAFPVLKTEPGRVAQIIVVTELLQSASRGDHPELVPALRALVAE